MVRIAAGLLAADVERVTGTRPGVQSKLSSVPDLVIAGTLGKSALVQQLISTGKITGMDKISGRWEATCWQIVQHPFKGVERALVIVGSDRRGTAYGLTQLSAAIGVSPWYWWADVPVKKAGALYLQANQPCFDQPAVQYRGIFINDEDWGLNQWSRKTFEPEVGNIGPKTYAKVFELMLRLRLNYIWPAMHECSVEFDSIFENVQTADRYGIVAGASHCEPMLCNNINWDEKKRGPWNYSLNRDSIYNYWTSTVEKRGSKEAVWTVGIRGIHDLGMQKPPEAIPDRIRLMEQVFRDQRSLLAGNVSKAFGPVAQCFIPYKEVLPLYNAGLNVPEDVTLMWVDDNFGYIRRLSAPAERKRSGGAGVYWHLSYYGYPHSYLWINTTPPALMWEQLHKAWENDARKMWVINVGDIKPMELGVDYFSRLAWNPVTQQADAQPRFIRQFVTENFGSQLAAPVEQLLQEYYRLGTIHKPEMMTRQWALSLSDKEAAALKQSYEQLLQKEEALSRQLSPALQTPFFEIIGFPARILAASGLIFLHDRNAVYTGNSQHQQEIDRLKTYIEKQVNHYNNDIAQGKWKHMIPGMYTGEVLPKWSSQVAWPWGETGVPDTSNKALNPVQTWPAAAADQQTTAGKARWTAVAGLGGSGRAMALQPAGLSATWEVNDAAAPSLSYTFQASVNPSSASIDFLPTFRTYPGIQQRVAVGVDGKVIAVVEVPGSAGKEDENGQIRSEGIRNNYVRATVPLPALSPGVHRLFIRAVDPGVVIDRVQLYPAKSGSK